MNHSHQHSAPRRAAALPPSPLGTGLGTRLAIAAAATSLLWLAVLWALA